MEIKALVKKIKEETPYQIDYNDTKKEININLNTALTFVTFNTYTSRLSSVHFDYIILDQFGNDKQKRVDNLFKLLYFIKNYMGTLPNNRGIDKIYVIQMVPGEKDSYLLRYYADGSFKLGSIDYDPRLQRAYTSEEIEMMKKEDKIAIDWDKVIISPLDNF